MTEKQLTNLCPVCGTEIAKSAKSCPQCGAKNKKPIYKRPWFIIITILVVLIAIGSALGDDEPSPASNNNAPVSGESVDTEETNTEETNTVEPETPKATVGEVNALGTAETYLYMGGFSKQGLREQLKYEQYSDSEIDYAIENCNADWKEQAAISAENYMNSGNFSRGDLFDQLKFEGFTDKQANYGLEAAGY